MLVYFQQSNSQTNQTTLYSMFIYVYICVYDLCLAVSVANMNVSAEFVVLFKNVSFLETKTAISRAFLKVEDKQKMFRNSWMKAEYLKENLFVFLDFLYIVLNLKIFSSRHFKTRWLMRLQNELGRDFCKSCIQAQSHPNRYTNMYFTLMSGPALGRNKCRSGQSNKLLKNLELYFLYPKKRYMMTDLNQLDKKSETLLMNNN